MNIYVIYFTTSDARNKTINMKIQFKKKTTSIYQNKYLNAINLFFKTIVFNVYTIVNASIMNLLL